MKIIRTQGKLAESSWERLVKESQYHPNYCVRVALYYIKGKTFESISNLDKYLLSNET